MTVSKIGTTVKIKYTASVAFPELCLLGMRHAHTVNTNSLFGEILAGGKDPLALAALFKLSEIIRKINH